MAEMMKGNEAIAEAAVRAGVKFYAGYPITPSSEIMEYLSWRLPEVGGSFGQWWMHNPHSLQRSLFTVTFIINPPVNILCSAV